MPQRERLAGELGWFVGGLRAAAAARQQANKEDQLARQLVFFLFHFHLIEESEIKLRNGMKR